MKAEANGKPQNLISVDASRRALLPAVLLKL
jgi:hypothetical protein